MNTFTVTLSQYLLNWKRIPRAKLQKKLRTHHTKRASPVVKPMLESLNHAFQIFYSDVHSGNI